MADTVAGGKRKMFKIGSTKNLMGRLVSAKNGLYSITLAVSIEQYKLLTYLCHQNQMTASQIVRDLLNKVFAEDLKELEVIERRLKAKGLSEEEVLAEIREGFSVTQAKSRQRRKTNELQQSRHATEQPEADCSSEEK